MKVELPSLPELLATHQMMISLFGGLYGVRDEEALEACLERPSIGWGDQEFFPDLFSKTAALGYAIVRTRHPFVDGNKRTGFAAMVATLELNGFWLETDQDEVVEIVLRLADGEMKEEELVDWLRCSAVPR